MKPIAPAAAVIALASVAGASAQTMHHRMMIMMFATNTAA